MNTKEDHFCEHANLLTAESALLLPLWFDKLTTNGKKEEREEQ